MIEKHLDGKAKEIIESFKKLADIAHIIVMESQNGEIDIGEENEQALIEALRNLPGDPYQYEFLFGKDEK